MSYLEKNQEEETPCYQPENCDKPECQDKIVERHRMSEAGLKTMMEAFHTPVSGPKIFSASAIRTALNGMDCKTNVFALAGKENIPDSNDDISFAVENRPYDPNKIDHSIALILGMMRLHNPDEVHFYKARHGNGRFTIVFEAIQSGGVVYSGDHNDNYP